jgi:CBS domain-containing protein
MMKIRDLVNEKGNRVYAVPGNMILSEATQVMAEKNIGALIVVNEDKTIGVFTERDVLKQVAADADMDAKSVSEVVTTDIFIAQAEDDLEYAMTIMIQKNIRHLPVLDDGKLVGVLSMRDVVKVQVKSLEAEVRYMKDFLAGGEAQNALSDMW